MGHRKKNSSLKRNSWNIVKFWVKTFFVDLLLVSIFLLFWFSIYYGKYCEISLIHLLMLTYKYFNHFLSRKSFSIFYDPKCNHLHYWHDPKQWLNMSNKDFTFGFPKNLHYWRTDSPCYHLNKISFSFLWKGLEHFLDKHLLKQQSKTLFT